MMESRRAGEQESRRAGEQERERPGLPRPFLSTEPMLAMVMAMVMSRLFVEQCNHSRESARGRDRDARCVREREKSVYKLNAHRRGPGLRDALIHGPHVSLSLSPFVRNECLPTCESSRTSTSWRGEESIG